MNIRSFLFSNISLKQTVTKNTFWLSLSYGCSKLLKFFVVVLAARALGPEGYGVFSYTLSFVGLFFIFSDMGIGTLVVRDYHHRLDLPSYLKTSFMLKVFFAIGAGILAAVGFWFGVFPVELYALLVLFFVISNIRDFAVSLLRALQRMEYEFIVHVVESLVVLVAGFSLFMLHPSPAILASAYAIGSFVGLASAYYYVRNNNLFAAPWSLTIARQLTFSGFPMALFGLTSFIFFSTDQLLLGFFRGSADVGYYAVVARSISIAALIPAFLSSALFPSLSQHINNPTLRARLFNNVLLILGIAGAGIAAAGFFLAPFVIPYIFGPEYIPSVRVFQVLVWIIIFLFPNIFLDYFLFARNKQWLDFGITFSAALLNLILNIAFIPVYGMYGAAIASIFAQGVNLVVTYSYAGS